MTNEAANQPCAAPQSGVRQGLDGAQLKWIALVTMLIDHTGAVVVVRLLAGTSPAWLASVYDALRIIGRLAFPIYCFLLTEGFAHTRSRPRYLARLAAFALAAEIPFDLALRNTWFYPGYQNVFFTLALGLAAIWGLERFAGRPALGLLAVVLAGAAAFVLKTDYGFFGVGLICVFYLFRQSPRRNVAVAAWILLGMILYRLAQYAGFVLQGLTLWELAVNAVRNSRTEWPGILSLCFINRYNGRRGGGMPKYFFYVFYPAHLLALWGIASLLTR